MARALISVADKRGVEQVGRRLEAAGFEIVATGGTAKALSDAGVTVVDVSAVTGFPEILDGRVKTLHPAIHGGLLARRDRNDHLATLEVHEIATIDVAVLNLYPFENVVGQASIDHEEAIENIDIGGPAMLRAAAKNYASVIVLIDPADYETVLDQIERGGVPAVDESTRRRLAAKAFEHVASYDSLVAAYLRDAGEFPAELPIAGRMIARARYGENPHQQAAIYARLTPGPKCGIASWRVHQDKQLSYNNYLDASAAVGCVAQFDYPAAVIVKHTIPCGVGLGESLPAAYERALSGDPVSAFGGILAVNRRLDMATVVAIGRHRFDIIAAPEISDEALERLERRKNLRIVMVPEMSGSDEWEVRSIPGGLLVQEPDRVTETASDWTCVTSREPTSEEVRALEFAWRVSPWVKSNAIVLARDGVVTGIGSGQPNRVESVRIAVKVAGERAAGSVLASDAFFPFRDGVDAAGEAGVTAIVQPGGSVRDEECIEAANAAGIAMLFTGRRHFRH